MKLFGNSSSSDHSSGQRSSQSGAKAGGQGEILPKSSNSSGNIPPASPAKSVPPQQPKPQPKAPPPPARASGGSAGAPPLPPKKNFTALRGILIGFGIVVLLVLVAAAYFLFFYGAPPDVNPTPTPGRPSATLPPAPSPSPTATARPTASLAPSPEPTPEETEPPEDAGDAPAVPLDSQRKDGVYTILLVGVDKESNSTDTIMVVSFDTKNHKLTGTSIPRDTLINIGWFTTPKRINAVYPACLNNNEDPVAGLEEQIKNLLGFYVDNYVVVYLQAVVDAVDAIGGVEFDVPEGMYYNDPYQDLYISIDPGLQTLNGENALKLCRFRNTYAEGDLKRIRVQHDFLKAMASQLIQKGISNLPELAQIILNDVDTDLTLENIVWFARQFLRCKSDDVVFQTAPIDGSGINNISFVGLRVDEWLEMINNSINPYVANVTTGNVNILTFGGPMGIYSTTGAIDGGWESFACYTCGTPYHGPGEHTVSSTAGEGGGAPPPAAADNEQTGPVIETVYADAEATP
ncbi:MAG: LCP family protein [Oscillospiraceae bacterium]|nr:LCP family protein [Oscillospiraceae bacterium]